MQELGRDESEIYNYQRMINFRIINSLMGSILNSSAYGFGNAHVSSGKLCSGVAKIWLFGPHSVCSLIQPKLFASFRSTSSRKSWAPSVIELIQLTLPLKNFQVSKALLAVSADCKPQTADCMRQQDC